MGRKRKYTAQKLRRAVEEYFEGITRYVAVTEARDTGRKDNYGHAIYEQHPVENQRGEQVERLEYIRPPSLGGLCIHLGISRDTWAEYSASEELGAICRSARERVQLWNEEELLTRKDVKGIIFNLQNNFGYTDKKEVNVHDGVEAYLRKLGEDGGEQEF